MADVEVPAFTIFVRTAQLESCRPCHLQQKSIGSSAQRVTRITNRCIVTNNVQIIFHPISVVPPLAEPHIYDGVPAERPWSGVGNILSTGKI